jgi:hypothetical protein
MEPEGFLPYSQVLNIRVTSSANTPPPPLGEPNGGVFHLRIVSYPKEAYQLMSIS